MTSSNRRFNWLVIGLTALLFAALIVSYRVPADIASASTSLSGTWKMKDGTVGETWADPSFDDSSWADVRLPGAVMMQGGGTQVWLRRWFELPTSERGQEHFVMFGDTRGSFCRLYVNGQFLGEDGVRSQRLKDESTVLTGFDVPGQLLQGERVLLAFQVENTLNGWEGLHDSRFVFGPTDVVKPYFVRTTVLDTLLRTSPVLLAVVFLALLVALLLLEGKNGDQRRYFNVMGVIVACLLWQLSRTGLVLTVDVVTRRVLNFFGMLGILGAALELAEHHYLAKVTWFRRVNRYTTVAMVATVLLPFWQSSKPLSIALLSYLMLPMARTLFLAVRSLARGPTGLGILLDVGVVTLTAAGGVDMLEALGLVHTPQLFPAAANYLTVMAATFVVGDFLGISRANQELSVSLQKSNLKLDQLNHSLEKNNTELAHALEQAQVAVRVKGEFLAKVSHELRTPLNAIINIPEGLIEDFPHQRTVSCHSCNGSFELDEAAVFEEGGECPSCRAKSAAMTASTVYTGTPARTRGYLETIQRSGKHLLSVVDQVLDFSKLEAGKMVLTVEEVKLAALWSDLEQTLTPVAAQHKVRLTVPQVEGTMHADPVKLMQVLINLVANAVKFSPEGGLVEVAYRRDETGHLFWVKDQGIGIAPEHQQLIFEGFRQVEGGNTRRYGGTGLGLAITRELVALHGGTVWLESEVGKGTTFFFRMPVEPLAPAAEPAQPEPAPRKPTKTILVVDDEPVVVETLRLVLESTEFEIEAVSDPRLALEAIRRTVPVLVILDVMMPRISGLSILRDLRGEPNLAHLPVLVLSAYHSNQEAVESLGAKWMSKPWHKEALEREVAALIQAK